MSAATPQRNQEITLAKRPIFTEPLFESLKIDDEMTDIDPLSPHPFFPELSEEEKTKAQDIAVSYLKRYVAGEPYQYAFIRKEGQDVTEGKWNIIEVHIHRTLYGIPIIGGGIRMFIDRDDWQLVQVMDAMKLWSSSGRGNTAPFRKPVVTIGEAWEKLKERILLRLSYKLVPDFPAKGANIAVPVYTADCGWICNAVTGELVKLAAMI